MGQFVLYKDVNIIDLDDKDIETVSITDDLNGFILSLVDRINESNKLQYYKSIDENKHVIKLIKEIILSIHTKTNEDMITEKMNSISKRLLEVELATQEKIERLNVKMRKGCLLQTVYFNTENEEYLYLLTKTDFKKVMVEETFSIKNAFETEKKELWRSCLVHLSLENGKVQVGDIKIFLDSTATHWHENFLELEPILKNEQNTKLLFVKVDEVINNIVSPNSKHEYFVLRNNLIGYMRRNTLIDYSDLMDKVFINYEGEYLQSEVKDNLLRQLEGLPEKKGFSRQFTCEKSAIKARLIKKTYELSDGIDLVIKDRIKNLDNSNDIYSTNDGLGNKYIVIKTNNKDAYETFLVNGFKSEVALELV
jgi:hypothetical protein